MKGTLLLLVILFSFLGFAQPYQGFEKKSHPLEAKAAGCVPPSFSTYMSINNVRMLVHTAGNLWQMQNLNLAVYEVPKGSGIMSLFTAALWLGGTDASGQLKLAALRYREGQDYWTGPLSENLAAIDALECAKYDRHFVSTQDEIRQFKAWFEAGEYDVANGTSTQSTLFPDYQIPEIIKTWPAHGDIEKGQDYYLAPFYDKDQDGTYNWENGDYPWYDIDKEKECGVDRRVSLYGDLNYWWVMNDKGNIHTETGSEPIGMEIRAQAFAFASNDEINNMTFYNYELINRGTQTLQDTYFGSFTDGALGNPNDDFVGCDVNRGLGYYYNGNNFDADDSGWKGYGFSPPAVGVDFFEGPFQDNDGIDNAFGIGPNEALNGIGYGDGIVDNERFGMRRFLYYSNTTNGANPSQTDPINAIDYYNYLRGYWKDGSKFVYGGSGHVSDPQANPAVPCDFMFPGDTDPLGWGTAGNIQSPWTEQSSNNVPNDRRFVQSAGPFVLKPGAVNNITVGVVWARSLLGDPFESVIVLQRADDKAQALFENCFRVLDAPHAPEVSIQELENGLVISLSNLPNSNNFNEEYTEFDPLIVSESTNADKFYRFQGYQIYQLLNDKVSSSELEDPAKARIVAQCDIKDSVASIINFEYDESLQASNPVKKVTAANNGIKHSFYVQEDLFATGDRKLVNFKTYYYMAIAYAHNNYATYNPNEPTQLSGQKLQYLPSRKAAIGNIKVYEGVPHNPMPETDGTYQQTSYGMSPKITRLDGVGNGNRSLELTASSRDQILSTGYLSTPTYAQNNGPINVKVVDPLNVADGYFVLKFRDYIANSITNEIDSAQWTLLRYNSLGGELLDSVLSERTMKSDNEQLIPEWGISVQLNQIDYYSEGASGALEKVTSPISSSIDFSDSTKRWLQFIEDRDIQNELDWIGAGSSIPEPTICTGNPNSIECLYKDFGDPNQQFERLLSGGIAPHKLVRYDLPNMPLAYHPLVQNQITTARKNASISYLPSVDIILTSDKSKWTRCPVIELGLEPSLNVGNAQTGELRKSPSVNKNGMDDGSGTMGMGWFPGYAIDLETGARLYMAFGENSFMSSDNGADMIWNPTSRIQDGSGNYVLGGLQPIWLFGTQMKTIHSQISLLDFPHYDPASTTNFLEEQFAIIDNPSSPSSARNAAGRMIYSNLMWIVNPLKAAGHTMLSSDVTIKIRVNKEYKNFVASDLNQGRPMYAWNMSDVFTDTRNSGALAEALQLINVVPNPYYAFSEYERNRLDNRIKITNLPEKCSVKIYSTNGKLVKTFEKDSPITWIDWLLVNNVNIPIASGVYLIHVEVPGVGERVLKAFIAMRTVDLHGT